MIRPLPVKNWLRRRSAPQWALAGSFIVVLLVMALAPASGTRWQSVSGLSFSPDGRQLAIGVYRGRLERLREQWYLADVDHCVWIATPLEGGGLLPLPCEHHSGIVNMIPEILIGPSISFSTDGKRLASAAFDGAFNVWNSATGQLEKRVTTPRPHVRTFAAIPKQDLVATAFRHWIAIWTAGKDDPANSFETGVNIQTMAPSPDGRTIAVAGLRSPAIEFLNLAKNTKDRFGSLDDSTKGITAMAYSRDGKLLLAADDLEVRLIDPASRNVVDRLPERLVLALAVSPDTLTLATGRFDGVTLWNLREREKRSRPWRGAAVESVQFSPDGKLLAIGANDGTVHVSNVSTGQTVWEGRFENPQVWGPSERTKVVLLAVWLFALSLYGGIALWQWSAEPTFQPSQQAPKEPGLG